MIIEMRTYQLFPDTVAEVEKRTAELLPAREKFSPLAGYWHTEVGPLNQVVHVWPYDSYDHRTQVRADAVKAGVWPPKIAEFVESQTSEIFLPAPFSPKLEPRQLGGLYEMRRYTLETGGIPAIIARWAPHIERRSQLSPLVGAWYSEFGALNTWIHVWAYKDAVERAHVRADAIARGIWPPPPGPIPGRVVKQENKFMVPAAFSPLR